MGAHVFRQVAGLGAGLPAEGALKDELAPRPIPLPHARPTRVHSLSFTKRRIPCPLVSHHRSDHRRILLGGTGQTVGQPHFSDLSVVRPLCQLKKNMGRFCGSFLLCAGELNAIRKQNCFICSPFYGRACRWAMLGELKPQGPEGPMSYGRAKCWPVLGEMRFRVPWSLGNLNLVVRFPPGSQAF